MQTYEMTSDQVDQFLTRTPSAKNAVLEHNALVALGIWGQAVEGSIWDNELGIYLPAPIPADGLRFNDSRFGPVVIFPDANGSLHFLTETPGTIGTRATPSGLPTLPTVGDIQATVFGVLGIGIVGYLILRRVS